LLPQCGGKEWREIVARLRIGPDMNDSALAAIAVWIEKFAGAIQHVEIMRRASKGVQRKVCGVSGRELADNGLAGPWPPS
jgi:hypothetical protein